MGDYLQKACACSDRWWDTRCGKRHRLGSVVCTMCWLPPTLFMKPYADKRPFSSVSAAHGYIQLCCSAKYIKSLSLFMQDSVLYMLHIHYLKWVRQPLLDYITVLNGPPFTPLCFSESEWKKSDFLYLCCKLGNFFVTAAKEQWCCIEQP